MISHIPQVPRTRGEAPGRAECAPSCVSDSTDHLWAAGEKVEAAHPCAVRPDSLMLGIRGRWGSRTAPANFVDLDGIFMISTSGRHDHDPIVGDTLVGYLDSVLNVAIPVESIVAVGARREVSP